MSGDKTDAWMWKSKNEAPVETVDSTKESSQVVKYDPNADFYKIDHPKRGKAIIFNHYKFDNPRILTRDGTKKDGADLSKILQTLGFDVSMYEDLKYGQLFDKLEQASKDDYSDCDCLVIAVMSHGDKGVIYARDHTYEVETLWNPFTGNKCRSLIGKPKMFFIQACRGEELDEGVRALRSVVPDSAPPTFLLPTMADILVMYSTFAGHYSFRSGGGKGAWFIQSLCVELGRRWKKDDVMSILTAVNRRMAVEYESHTSNNFQFDKKKQIGQIVSTLTKRIYFGAVEEKLS